MLNQRTRTFEWANGGTVEPGWIPVGAGEGWYPGGGFLAAHDLMEHLSDKSDWKHELRATGMALFDRRGVRTRDLNSIVRDTVSFAAIDHDFDAPPAPALAHKPLPEKHERDIQAFAKEARKNIADGLAAAAKDKAEVPENVRKNSGTFVDKALPWVRLGYRDALRVFGDNGHAVGELVDRVRDAVNNDHDMTRPLLGDRLTITVDTKALTLKLARSGNEGLSAAERDKRATSEHVKALMDALLGGPL